MLRLALLSFVLALSSFSSRAMAQSRFIDIRYTPTTRAQVAIWIERADGTFLRTLMLTEAVARRGIGNRPGALQMNSGFRWPYGRREGVLPIWAHRRVTGADASPFPRVIFQARYEGYASQMTQDQSRDTYFCLSFNDAANSDVDATSCASVFNSDKGRYLNDQDLELDYAEPFEALPGIAGRRELGKTSLYPMRRDLDMVQGRDHQDILRFAADARAAMPGIDAVTRATAAGDTPQLFGFSPPDSWPDGDYVIYLEVNTERDFSSGYTEAMHPTPLARSGSWDSWAATFGYAYRGQPSVLFRVPIHLSVVGSTAAVSTAEGFSELQGFDGNVRPLDSTIANDPVGAPGSGVDRLRLEDGERVSVRALPCVPPPPIPAVPRFEGDAVGDKKHSHEWAHLRFEAVGIEGRSIIGYRVKVSTSPIVDDETFEQAEDAKMTTDAYQGLDLCPYDRETGYVVCPPTGANVEFEIGKLNFQTQYHVAIRAIGPCNTPGPISTTQIETTKIHFTTVAPCFIATAAYGSPIAEEVDSLRRIRDSELMPTRAGRAFVDAYYSVGPSLASFIEKRPALRSLARAALRPFVQLANLRDSQREARASTSSRPSP